MEKKFFEAVKTRRTHYGLTKEKIVSEDKILEIVREAVTHTPSAFNSQSARVVVLFDGQSERLWEIVKEELKKIVSAVAFKKTEEKVDGSFKSGYGTILFFEDMKVIEGLQEKFSTYSDNFPIWSNQSAGMHQFVIWTALSAEGLGASLQHYNPVIDSAVKKEWNIPEKWKLLAQMPFGKPIDEPAEKEVMPLEERIKIYR